MADEHATIEQVRGFLAHQGPSYLSGFERIVKDAQRALFLADHLFQMIPREVWREQGAEWQGQYEGDYWAEGTYDELVALHKRLDDEGS